MESEFGSKFNVNLIADKKNLKHLYPPEGQSKNNTFYKKDQQAAENVVDIMY
jgi:hypothetical protein